MPDIFDLEKKPSPFASKKVGDKSLYKRGHGITQNLTVGENVILFAIPYPWVKITGVEIIGGAIGDKMSILVLDSAAGTYSGEANKVLNQFAFDLNIRKDYHMKASEYDADLYQGMQLKIAYASVTEKTVGINFDLNEVK